MVIMQCVTVILLCLLLIRSINHDDRMGRLEKFVCKIVASIKQNEQENKSIIGDQIFSGEAIENIEEDDTDDRIEETDEAEQREDF